jgi:hypothetical protein
VINFGRRLPHTCRTAHFVPNIVASTTAELTEDLQMVSSDGDSGLGTPWYDDEILVSSLMLNR